MRVLVFGATGQLGRCLAEHFPQEVIAVGRAEADLTKPDDILASMDRIQPHAVINAAAFTDVDGAEAARDMAFTINCDAPAVMAERAARMRIPFVHVSTDYVFDGSGDAPWHTTDTPAPLNVYGASKLAGERAVHAAHPDAVVIRTSWVFSHLGSNFATTMMRLAVTFRTLDVVSDQIGGPTPASALAKATMAAAGRTGAGGAYHFSGAPDVGWAEFAMAIFQEMGADVAVTPIPTSDYPARPAQRPLNSRLECSKFEDTFGLRRPDWRTAVQDIVRNREGGENS
ncbi:MAG: dTDP-4-dehydrorhamnose reductase [Rhodobacteraceae bacterium]|nr:dTDP-4-dehydrorhamnose reductase [Paracoccaceae bacterium]